jgi:hypothetical protein
VNALMTRQSVNLREDFFAKEMDARVKPAHDEWRTRTCIARACRRGALQSAAASGRLTLSSGLRSAATA